MMIEKEQIHQNQRLLSIYTYYRLGMSVLLCLLFVSNIASDLLGTDRPDVFLFSSFVYIGLCFTSLTLFLLGVLTTKTNHILFLLITDVIALSIIIYSSHNASAALGYLLLIPMAVSGTFLKGQINIGMAAFASLVVLGIAAFNIVNHYPASLFTAGITGTLLFITAAAFRLFAKKIDISELELKQQVANANHMQHIGERIVETMNAGIIVYDRNLDIQLINKTAYHLLSYKEAFHSTVQISAIHNELVHWKRTGSTPAPLQLNLGVNHDIKISFTDLSDDTIVSIMLFIEDERRITTAAQQLKLASLGRLTASIAHEVRNPLGAISHASQLLDESENHDASDRELLSMIHSNSLRINQIIDNILEFSRKKAAQMETIHLNRWLEQFIKDYLSHHPEKITLHHREKHSYCQVDPDHLYQIMTNLLDNAVKHGTNDDGKGKVFIDTYIDHDTRQLCIDIMDEGDGIDEVQIEKIFEPFYTTKKTGSGLGLYLCKELCRANQADIVYLKKHHKQKSCFRLLLAPAPKRSINSA